MKNHTVGLEDIILEESYALGFLRRGNDIVIAMEFLLANNREALGELVFTNVLEETWHSIQGKQSSMEEINSTAHRYYGGDKEAPDLGAIDSISSHDGFWELFADWGHCRLRTSRQPLVVLKQ